MEPFVQMHIFRNKLTWKCIDLFSASVVLRGEFWGAGILAPVEIITLYLLPKDWQSLTWLDLLPVSAKVDSFKASYFGQRGRKKGCISIVFFL